MFFILEKESAAGMKIFSIHAGLAFFKNSHVLVILVFDSLRLMGAEALCLCVNNEGEQGIVV